MPTRLNAGLTASRVDLASEGDLAFAVLERRLSQIGGSRSSVVVDALPAGERAAAAAILGRAATVTLPAGTTRPGTGPLAAAALMIVEDGLVLLSSARAAASREVVCALASAGNVLLPPGPE